jgi:prepilin-type processing-associated H-X9-DG protein
MSSPTRTFRSRSGAVLGRSRSGGANIAFADGSVRFVQQSVTIAFLASLVTKDGGEVVAGNDF